MKETKARLLRGNQLRLSMCVYFSSSSFLLFSSSSLTSEPKPRHELCCMGKYPNYESHTSCINKSRKLGTDPMIITLVSLKIFFTVCVLQFNFLKPIGINSFPCKRLQESQEKKSTFSADRIGSVAQKVV